MEKSLAPIALFCYNRLEVLAQTVEKLKKNILAEKSVLIIFLDGAKQGQEENVEAVRSYIRKIDGFKSVKIIESEKNNGLANSIIKGVTKVINEYGKIIVLEDDLITSPYFLNYMNDALDMYEKDYEVGCITGYTYPIKKGLLKKNPQSFFIKGADCWGWATWKRAWDLFEEDGQKLLNEIKERNLEADFDFDNSYPYIQMLCEQIQGKNNSWAIRWYASCYVKDKLCLYLSEPVVSNIGFGNNATHCIGSGKDLYVNINKKPFLLKKIKIKENKVMKRKFSLCMANLAGKPKKRFLYNKEKIKNKRIITILGFIKFEYSKK